MSVQKGGRRLAYNESQRYKEVSASGVWERERRTQEDNGNHTQSLHRSIGLETQDVLRSA